MPADREETSCSARPRCSARESLRFCRSSAGCELPERRAACNLQRVDPIAAACCNAGVALSFDPDDSSFSRINALYLAHASDIAYHRAPSAAAMERLGL